MLLGVLVLGGGAACTGGREPLHDQAVAQAPFAVPTPSVDVPALLSLTIDQLPAHMGPLRPVPPGFVDPTRITAQLHAELPDSVGFFNQHGLAMVATYNYRTRRLNDLLLLGRNENELMHRGRLRLGELSYLVLPVFEQNQSSRLLGLRVVATALND